MTPTSTQLAAQLAASAREHVVEMIAKKRAGTLHPALSSRIPDELPAPPVTLGDLFDLALAEGEAKAARERALVESAR